MKPKYSSFDELTEKSPVLNVKVKVIEKSRVFQSPGKKKYQRILLQDLKGSVMKGTLFEEDIQAYEEVIKQNKEYVISNATVRLVNERYQTKDGELQMTFNSRTVIQPICTNSEDDAPQYHTIASIPRSAGPYDRYDILGVVVFVRGIQKVKGMFGKENDVCDILIVDQSSHQPLTISAWNDLAGFFDTGLTSYPIVGFTSLKVTTHRGFSLATTMSSTIISTPVGEKAELLRQWAATHTVLLSQKREHLLGALTPNNRAISTIAFVKAKTVSSTVPDDRYWIKAFISSCSYNDIKKFLGCSNCNKKTDMEKNEVFHCPWCHKKDCTSIPRLALTFDAKDSTGSITLTAFTDVLTQLFGKTLEELYQPNSPESLETCQQIAQSLSSKPVYIELGPTSALSRNGVLKWVLKSASLEPNEVKYEDTLRRFNVLVNGDQCLDINMENLRLKICSLFHLASTANFSLVYTDEDNDLVTLGDDEDLHDVVKQGLNPVRINVYLRKDKTKIGASSSGNTTPRGSSMPNSKPKVKPNVAEVLKSVPEPLLQAITKISTELTSKAASTSPVLGDLLDGLSKMGQTYLPSDNNTSTLSGHSEGRGGPTQNAPTEQKVDTSTDFNEVKHKADAFTDNKEVKQKVYAFTNSKEVKDNDIPSSSPAQKSSKSTQAIREAEFVQPALFPFLQLDGNSISEQMKGDFEKAAGKRRGFHTLKSSKGGVRKHIYKDVGKSAALGNRRGFILGDNPCKSYYDLNSRGECLTSRIHDQEKLCHGNFYKDDLVGSIFHKGVRCDGCGVLPIIGPRFKSKVKHDYDLCRVCFGFMGNDLDYTRIDFPMPYRHPCAFNDFDDLIPRKHTGKQAGYRLDSCFIMDVTIMDGTVMASSTHFVKTWRMCNNGSLPWPRGVQLVWMGGERFASSNSIEIQVPIDGLSVGKEVDIAVKFVAPELPGRYISYWMMADASGLKFGQLVWVSIQVDASVNLTKESLSRLNLNLPDESTTETSVPKVPDLSEPEMNVEAPVRSPSMIEQKRKIEIKDLNFPVNNQILVTGDVVNPSSAGASSSSVPVIGPNNGNTSSFASNHDVVANGSHAAPSAFLNLSYPIINQHDGSSASSGSKNDQSDLEHNHGKNSVEETLLKELEEMGFKQVDLNKEVLKVNEYDIVRSVDELCGVTEWDPILEELKEMGFEDKERNKQLLEKNNRSITQVIMDLIDGERP